MPKSSNTPGGNGVGKGNQPDSVQNILDAITNGQLPSEIVGGQLSDDTATTDENAAILIDALANDNVNNGTLVGAVIVSGAGSVSIVGDQVKFDPLDDFDHLAEGETAEVVIT